MQLFTVHYLVAVHYLETLAKQLWHMSECGTGRGSRTKMHVFVVLMRWLISYL
jgi:hypothetical protein